MGCDRQHVRKKAMTDVCLVLMPYAGISRPSIALGLLKASLQQNDIQAAVLYPNIWFAEEIGLDAYETLSEEFIETLLGEWTFAGAAFPDFVPDHAEYLKFILERLDFSRHLGDRDLKEVFWDLRKKAALFIDRVARSVLELQPRIVSCSSTFQQHCASLALLRRIRELQPEVITLMGGANCEEMMGLATHREFPWVDFIASGEGDDLFAKLCRKLLDKGRDVEISQLPYGVIGPAHRRSSNALTQPPRASIESLDRVPIPDYDDYFYALRHSSIAPFVEPGLLIETARGCWWGQKHHCTFCGLNGGGMSFRSKSSARVLEEFTYLSERYGLRKFQVVDNILDMAYFNTVLPQWQQQEDPYTIFYETKANLKREHVQHLAKAGIRWLQPGIENMHDSALKLLNKGNTVWMNVQLLKWAKEFGIVVNWNFLSKIPGESDEWYSEMVAWLPAIAHLQPPGGVARIRYDRFSPYHERPEEWGLTLAPLPPYKYIYPLSTEALNDLAYFFVDRDEALGKNNGAGKNSNRPGLEALRAWVTCWQALWKRNPPILSMSDNGNSITIYDTRPCATERLLLLDGLDYWVYKACDRALTQRELVTALREQVGSDISWSDIEPIVTSLQTLKILLACNGRWLSLAVKEPSVPFPQQSECPAGYVDVRGFRDGIIVH
jgi:magnesium-protoporphyrin IX monomethyl ester (oxidative) cyclase